MVKLARPGDTLLRRNSSLRLQANADGYHVIKRYHGKYRREDELRAYSCAAPVVEPIENMRTVAVLDIAGEDNVVCLEYIYAPNLAELLAQQGLRGLLDYWPRILAYLAGLYASRLTLDCDPSNFLASDGELVIIDPTMESLDLSHGSAAIFFIGIVKYRLRYPLRLYEARVWRRFWARAVDEYLHETDADADVFYADIGRYIDHIITWNKYEGESETMIRQFVRRCVYVPGWRLVRRRLVHGRTLF